MLVRRLREGKEFFAYLKERHQGSVVWSLSTFLKSLLKKGLF
jgi:hypothetical protein